MPHTEEKPYQSDPFDNPLTDRSEWKHADGPHRTSLDKMPKHDFKKWITNNLYMSQIQSCFNVSKNLYQKISLITIQKKYGFTYLRSTVSKF